MSLDPVIAVGRQKNEAFKPIADQPGKISWLPLDLLLVDRRYQRPVRDKGLTLIRRIAEGFSWTRFTPLIVARTEDGRYAIVDGQHRAAAAKLRGDLTDLPCWIIEGDLKAQARAFIAINQGGAVHALAAFHAGRAAGEPDALHLFAVCDRAGIEVLRYPVGAAARKPHQTLSPAEIVRAVKLHGDGPVIRALEILRRAGTHQEASLLTRALIRVTLQICLELGPDHDARIEARLVRQKLADLRVAQVATSDALRRSLSGVAA